MLFLHRNFENGYKMVKEIFNYFEYDEKLSAGGQPTEKQIEALRESGVEVVLSLSPTSTPNYLQSEADLVEGMNMQYVHFPVNCSNLKPEHFTAFKGLMSGLNGKKTFVHCGGNIKTSNLIHMYNVVEKGLKEEDSLKELKQIQEPEPKWIDYFKSFGMQGLS